MSWFSAIWEYVEGYVYSLLTIDDTTADGRVKVSKAEGDIGRGMKVAMSLDLVVAIGRSKTPRGRTVVMVLHLVRAQRVGARLVSRQHVEPVLHFQL